MSPPRNKTWTRYGPAYWVADDYFIRRQGRDYELGYYTGNTRHYLGTFSTLEQAQAAIQKENPSTSDAYWDLALVLGLVGGAVYLVYKGAQALGTAVGKAVGSATPT